MILSKQICVGSGIKVLVFFFALHSLFACMEGSAGPQSSDIQQMPDSQGKEPSADEEGFLSGSWDVLRAADDQLIVTLHLIQQDTFSGVAGTFSEPGGIEGRLNYGKWENERLSISWSRLIGGVEMTFEIRDALRKSDDLLEGLLVVSSADGSDEIQLLRHSVTE
jgi:hypothetical protein